MEKQVSSYGNAIIWFKNLNSRVETLKSLNIRLDRKYELSQFKIEIRNLELKKNWSNWKVHKIAIEFWKRTWLVKKANWKQKLRTLHT